MSERRTVLTNVVPWLSPVDFMRSVARTSSGLSLKWYLSHFSAAIVPDHASTINGAINVATGEAVQDAVTAETNLGSRSALVLVRPGHYSEAVRIAQTCTIVGFGPRQKVVVEAPGWESPLVFVKGNAHVSNLTIRCRIMEMRGKCVYIPTGRVVIARCSIEGGVHACGGSTAPHVHGCEVTTSPGNGLHFSDCCHGRISGCVVSGHKGHGILVDRGALPCIVGNVIRENRGVGIRILLGERGASSRAPAPTEAPGEVGENDVSSNAGGDRFFGGHFADDQEPSEDEDAMEELPDLFG